MGFGEGNCKPKLGSSGVSRIDEFLVIGRLVG
jgi:hypothetical protein